MVTKIPDMTEQYRGIDSHLIADMKMQHLNPLLYSLARDHGVEAIQKFISTINAGEIDGKVMSDYSIKLTNYYSDVLKGNYFEESFFQLFNFWQNNEILSQTISRAIGGNIPQFLNQLEKE